jgi:putative endonuclease
VAFFIFATMFYIYFLYSKSSDIYYIGYTDDYARRFGEHNSSDRDTFSKKHRPWDLQAVFEAGTDRGQVLKIERFIKKQKSRKLIERIISGEKLTGVLAQLVRVRMCGMVVLCFGGMKLQIGVKPNIVSKTLANNRRLP